MSKQDKNKREQKPKKALRDISPDAKKRALLLIGNTLMLTFIYFGSMGINQPILSIIVMVVYWLGFAGFLIAYIIYNRGFTQRGITEDMLPETWDREKKESYIASVKKREQDSKWMLSVIIPLMIPIALEAISLFTWPIIQDLFNFK